MKKRTLSIMVVVLLIGGLFLVGFRPAQMNKNTTQQPSNWSQCQTKGSEDKQKDCSNRQKDCVRQSNTRHCCR